MEYYESKYTGAEVDALLDKVNSGEVGGKVTVDSALSTESENPVMNRVVTAELGKKADTDGVYPDLIVGDLAGRGESVPAEFSFRASGGKSIKDGRAYIKRIKGNSVVWNQKLRNSRIENADYWYSERSNAEFNGQGVHIVATSEFSNLYQNARLILGHKYLLYASAKGNNGHKLNLNLGGQDAQGVYLSDNYAPHYFFIQFNEYLSDMVQVYVVENDADWYVKECRLIDLTQEFQAGNEPSTIEEYEARKPIVADEYAYNEGEVIHMTAEGIKSVGDNSFNGVWYQGAVTENSGHPTVGSLADIHTDTFRVIGGETYCSQFDGADLYLKGYFFDKSGAFIGSSDFDVRQGTKEWVVPINADSVRMRIYNAVGNITPSQAPNVMVSLVHSGWKQDTDAGYQPYWEDKLPLPIIRKYFPQGMKSAGSAHDEIRFNKASGKWEAVQRVTSLDLGTLAWGSADSSHFYVTNVLGDIGFGNLRCAKYSTGAGQFGAMAADKVIGNNAESPYNRAIFVRDDAYTDAASFKAAMQGVMLYYELAEPVIREIDEPIGTDYRVADFGTEQAISSTPSAPFSADIIYQFNAVDMIREHELEINELQQMIATMQAKLASLTSNNA